MCVLALTAAALSVSVVQAVAAGCSTNARLENLSTRMQVLTGNDVMIGGFIIGGSTDKTVAVVATGPSLAGSGIANPLANPTLTLVRSSDQSVVATNDNWGDAPNAAQILASGFAPVDPLESAIMMSLPPGGYTAIVSGAGGGTGVGLVAVYEVDHIETPLVNISTRGQVLTGNDVMIAGFIIQGTAPQTVVVNVAGPSLSAAGISNPLADPTLTLVRSSDNAIIATNDNWGDSPDASKIQATGFAPNNPLEPAVIMTLDPGAYTAIVRGAGGATGVGLVGVFAAAPVAPVAADFSSGATWVTLTIAQGQAVAVALPQELLGIVTELRSIQSTNTQTDLTDEIAISSCPGNFDVLPECKTWGTVWGSATYLRAFTTLPAIAGICSMDPSVRYYANVRNVKFDLVTPACNAATCDMKLQFNTY